MGILPATVTSSTISLPIIGSVSVITAAAIGLGVYFLFFRGRRRTTSKTTTIRYGR